MRTLEELKQGKTEHLQGLDPTLWTCMCYFLPLNMTYSEQYWWGEFIHLMYTVIG